MVVVHRAHSHHVRHVARHADRHWIRARVAGRGNHDNTGLPGCHHRLVQRVIPIIGLRFGAKRQVQYANILLLVMIDYPLDTLDHIHIGAVAVGIERPHDKHIRARGDAFVETVRR